VKANAPGEKGTRKSQSERFNPEIDRMVPGPRFTGTKGWKQHGGGEKGARSRRAGSSKKTSKNNREPTPGKKIEKMNGTSTDIAVQGRWVRVVSPKEYPPSERKTAQGGVGGNAPGGENRITNVPPHEKTGGGKNATRGGRCNIRVVCKKKKGQSRREKI